MLTTMQIGTRVLHRVLSVVTAVLAVTMSAVAVASQAPPQPNLRRYPPIWLGFLVMFVLLAAVLAISLMPSKRSHQD